MGEQIAAGELKRDPAVELARVLACLTVIGVHMWPGTSQDYGGDFSRNLVSCFVADGVAVFWLITGCFLFQNYSYGRLMRRTLKGVLVPMFAFSALAFFVVSPLIDGTFSLVGIFQQGGAVKAALLKLLHWQNPVSHCGHLWYLYVYVFVMACSPALFGLVRWLEEDRMRELGFAAATLAFFALNDLTGNEAWEFGHYHLGGAFPAAIEIVWGHLIYRHRDELAVPRRAPLYAGAFLGLNIVRALIQMGRYQGGSDNDYLLYWFSSFGLACAACVLLFALCIVRGRAATPVNRAVCLLGTLTFTVYLVHGLIIAALNTQGFKGRLFGAITGVVAGAAGDLLYVPVSVLLIAVPSFALAAALRGASRAGRNLLAASKGDGLGGPGRRRPA